MAASSSLAGSLKDVRVLDLSRVLAGPYCTQILADLGAEVIKVEHPADGDETRGWGPPFASGGLSAYFLACNRNKSSLALDLKHPEGKKLLHDLVRRSDVVVENFRADSRASLGLAATDLHALNPRAVVCSISGFGVDDPARRPGYDYVIQAMSGLMAMNGPADGEPHKFGVAIADIVTGLYASTAILAALHGRQSSGHGYAIDVALLDCAVAAQANVVQAFLCTGKEPRRQGHGHLQIVPYQMFAAADGPLVLAVGNDRQWRAFCAAAEASDLAAEAKYATNAGRVSARAELVPRVAALVATRTVEDWRRRLGAAKVPHGPVWGFDALFAGDDAKRLGLKISARTPNGESVDLVRSPLLREQQTASMPPALGEHSERVLRDVLGISDAEMVKLRASGVVTG
jgi:crotonobetainyl-CoA:carnitine CoA-transferase CaiB-like acyl-CoA transferase